MASSRSADLEEAGSLGRQWPPSHDTIDGADLAIAATAIVKRGRLLTRNTRHFPMFATRLIGSTSNPVWYAEQLAKTPASYRIVRCPELQEAARVLGQRLLAAGETPLI
ncbi:MAG: hypothetical protein WKF73_01400 [Nocardioidaceae bacterium]